MKFTDELYNYYKNKLTADEEDIDLLVAAVLQELSREDMLHVLSELSEDDLYKVTGTYIAEELRRKMMNDQDGIHYGPDKPNFYH